MAYGGKTREELHATLDEKVLKNVIPLEEVAKHTTDGDEAGTAHDIWVVIDGLVCDVSEYEAHPGGFHHLVEVAGTDATDKFSEFGHRDAAYRVVMRHAIGVVPEDDVVVLEEDTEEEVAEAESSIFTNPVYMIPLLIVVLAMIYKFVYLPQQAEQEL